MSQLHMGSTVHVSIPFKTLPQKGERNLHSGAPWKIQHVMISSGDKPEEPKNPPGHHQTQAARLEKNMIMTASTLPRRNPE